MTALSYLFVASLYMLLFYSCYWLLLRRNTFFGLNRIYLLSSLLLALILPLVQLPDLKESALPVGTIALPDFTIAPPQQEPSTLTVGQWIWVIYGLGVGLMLIRLGLNLRSVWRLIRSGTLQRQATFTLVCLPNDLSPSFSFGPYLVLNHTDAQTQPDALLRHEKAHIRQYHTADILFLEIVWTVFWFNPIVWLYKRALQEVHEFLADRAVLKTPQPDYPHQLVAYALNAPSTALITPFVSKSTLKQRIIMLQKPASSRWSLIGYALIVPLATLLVMCTQSEQDLPQSATTQASARKSVKVDGEVFSVVDNVPRFPGGMEKLGAYLSENLKFPEAARKANVEGKVFISFIVTKSGEIANVQIIKGIGYGADAEAVRVIKNMPQWEPGTQNGQVVNVKYVMPINFQLEDKKAVTDSPFKGIKHFIINGKEVDEKEVTALVPEKITRMDVNKEQGTISITTR